MTNTPPRKSCSASEQLSSSSYGLPLSALFDIYVLGNQTGFVPNSSVLRIQSVFRTPYSLARVGFGYLFDIYVLGNLTGFVPNSSVLRITPVLVKGQPTRQHE